MILRQTKAILVDAYREINAKKLFWITMVLSLVIVAGIATIGFDEEGVSVLWFDMSFIPVNSTMIDKDLFYISVFSTVGISLWLTWIATILALISTASIIPDLISGGTIETTLSKPISRSRLFLTKYFSGLLFVALQVGVFSVASFIVIGLRSGFWEPKLFIAIPIVLAFFSYLYAVSVLVGMITKAAMPAILMTCLLWAILFGLNVTDGILLTFKAQTEILLEQRTDRIEQIEGNTIRLIQGEMNRNEAGSGDGYIPDQAEIDAKNVFLPQIRADLSKNEANAKSLRRWSGIVFGIKTVLPKTGETAELLNRSLIDPDRFPSLSEESDNDDPNAFSVSQDETNRRVEEEIRSRSLWWVLGTSFIFEGLIVLFCTWRFTKRDF